MFIRGLSVVSFAAHSFPGEKLANPLFGIYQRGVYSNQARSLAFSPKAYDHLAANRELDNQVSTLFGAALWLTGFSTGALMVYGYMNPPVQSEEMPFPFS